MKHTFQFSDHIHRQFFFRFNTSETALFPPNIPTKSFLFEIHFFHSNLDCFDWISGFDVVVFLMRSNQSNKYPWFFKIEFYDIMMYFLL